MTTSTSNTRYNRLDPNNRQPWAVYFSKLAFSVKFIIGVCLLVTLFLFIFLIWGKNVFAKNHSDDLLENMARQRHAGMNNNLKNSNDDFAARSTRRPKSLRTLAPDAKLAISQCPHPHDPSPALLTSLRYLDDSPVCKKALFAAACQLEKGLLYDDSLQVTCPKDSNAPDATTSATPYILFVIDVNSGGARQIERLLINIYRSTHYYLLLIPSCFGPAAERLKYLQNLATNIRLLFYDVQCPDDGGADISVPQTIETWKFIIENSTGWNWNYLLSLDSFDFPLINVDRLSQFLENHAGTNFLESYSIDEKSDYVQNISTATCADGGRRWPIGRGKPPANLAYYQGPPWYLLTRQFLDYALFSKENDRLVVGLRKFSSMTPFAAQLLFHTLAHNGKFCHTFVNESLRLTKFHIFDERSRRSGLEKMKPQEQEQLSSWTFTSRDYVYLSPLHHQMNLDQQSKKVEKFFGRRFDPIVSQQIVRDVESTLYERPLFPMETPRLHSYWQTLWTNRTMDRRKSTLRYAAVARLLGDLCSKRLRRCPNFDSNSIALEKLTLFRDFDLNDGLILSMNVSCSQNDQRDRSIDKSIDIPMECLVNFQHHEKIKTSVTDITDLRNDLLHMRVGSDYDFMDNIFRNFAGTVLLDTNEKFGLRTQWIPGEMGSPYQFAWLDPSEVVAGTTFVNVGPWTTNHFLPTSDDLLTQRLQNGVWTAAILHEGKVVGATEFLVLPESPDVYERLEIKDRLRWAKRFFDVNRLCAPITASRKFAKNCQCGPPSIPSCETTSWSTLASDTKSNFALFLKRRNEAE